ncbi:MAG: glycosyltransferase family 4 protein [Gammaproteobacteria bacterium]|nr:glycosyltransferase family 4 protein [Gammaproteobacteria bacterium]
MNILLINKFFWKKGGSETVFFGEKELLEGNGHNVVPFSMHSDQNIDSEYSKYFVSEVSYDGQGLAGKLKAASKIIYSFEAKKNIENLLGDIPVDIAHFHIFQHQISPSVFGPLRKRKIPLVLTLHDLKPICPNYQMYTQGDVCEKCKGGKFYNCFLNKCTKNSSVKSFINVVEMYFHYFMKYYQNVDKFIAVSNFHRNKMIEFGFPAEQIAYIPNFIDIENFPYSTVDKGYAIYFGRLSEEKGLETLLSAAQLCPDIPLVIVGSGPLEKELHDYTITNNISNVEFVGYKSGKDLTDLLSNASFSILPSRVYENCPMAVLESLAIGKPVIGADIGGIPELISEDKDGYIYKNDDVQALVEKMNLLWNSPEKRLEMGKFGREKIARDFTKEKHYEALMSVYDDLTTAGA